MVANRVVDTMVFDFGVDEILLVNLDDQNGVGVITDGVEVGKYSGLGRVDVGVGGVFLL